MRKVTTPVPVEGGVAGGALPMSAGTSFQGRRKPKGSACHRRTMAAVQDEGEARDQGDVAVEVLAQRWRRREATGDMVIVRYADDIVVGFEHEATPGAFWMRCARGWRSSR